MDKHFISAADLLRDSFLLAEQIYASGFRPILLLASGGGARPSASQFKNTLNTRVSRVITSQFAQALTMALTSRTKTFASTVCSILLIAPITMTTY